ncbi:MAG: TSUP family transporter [Sphingobacteriaceae bacterium]|nr:TSUP family transporter [Sphingobacteriaceae bacterium]
MDMNQMLTDHGLIVLILLAIVSFAAGFIDAVVGGGGLVIIPFMLINFPNIALPVIFGTNKISAISGTAVAAIQYMKRVRFDLILLISISFFAFIASYLGAKTVSNINSESLKPFILMILIVIAVYTFFKKDLGSIQTKNLSFLKQIVYGSLFAIAIGFYDGFFGPGTGSFLVLAFVVVLGFEFVTASAYAKVINCVTNISALIVFIKNDQYILEMAILMLVCNVIGSYLGSKMALRRGNAFVRKIFLVVVSFMIARYGWEVFSNK